MFDEPTWCHCCNEDQAVIFHKITADKLCMNGFSSRIEKDKTGLMREFEDLQTAADSEGKAKTNMEKMAKQLELQVLHLLIS